MGHLVNRKRVHLNLYHWNFLNSYKCSCNCFPKILNITNIRQSDQNCHFQLSIKQIITLRIVIIFLSGRIKKHATEEFYIFSQSCDLVKTSCSPLIHIHAPQDSCISLIKGFRLCSSACFFSSMTSSLHCHVIELSGHLFH